MAVVKTQDEAFSSSMPPCRYHVFLSFRGEDTRKSFTDHLYTALVGAGFQTFRDNEGIERGGYIKLELERAITQSRCSTIVFSEDYASSSSCLDELVMILERKNTSEHVVLPVFYNVDPSDVKKQKGSFAASFAVHEDQCKHEIDGERRKELMEKVKGWRKALEEVVGLGGMVLQNEANGYEAKFIQKIVQVIRDKVNRTILSVPTYLVGIDSHVESISLWLQNCQTTVGVMAISGMGGVGKTTVAKYIFNLHLENFEGSTFLFNIREYSEQSDGLIRLQRKLLSDILKGKKEKISSVDEGIIKIKDALSCKRVLIVLDDVDKKSQLDAIVGTRDWFSPGSKIIITTRHVRLLPSQEVCKIHHVHPLDSDKSLALFSWHAFGEENPSEDYMDLSRNVVDHCGGLPLALEVMGASLNGLSMGVWESALGKLQEIPNNDIVDKLKVSYDTLPDHHDKKLFLEIACFFVQEDIIHTITILDGCGFYTTIGIQNLVVRCLLTIDKDNKIVMHQLLQHMAREIIRMESPNDPGKRSQLWNHGDSFNTLKENTGTETIEGMVLGRRMPKEKRETSFGISGAKGQCVEDFTDEHLLFDNSRKRRRFSFILTHTVNNVFSNADEVEFKTDAFARMRKLKILQISYCQLVGGYKDFPKKLKWLRWLGFPMDSLPNDFPLESLIALDICSSNLKLIWKELKVLKSLKILNLSRCYSLMRTPNFLGLPNLERLILASCTSLAEVHGSIGNLQTTLVLVNLKDCKKLRKLPREVGLLMVLETLIISGCSKLEELPIELQNLQSLKVLRADGITINSVVSTTEQDTSLHGFTWDWIFRSRKIPQLHLPRFLVTLSLEECNMSDDAFPKELGNMWSLRNINLTNNPICCLPDFIKVLSRLDSLEVNSCKRLRTLLGLPNVDHLGAEFCPLLERITFRSSLFHLNDCSIWNSEKVVEVAGAFKLESIANVDTNMFKPLGLYDLDFVKNIDMEWHNSVTNATNKGPFQVLYENKGIVHAFSPGSEAPSWFNTRVTGSSLSFIMPSPLNLSFYSLNLCFVYTFNRRAQIWGPKTLFVLIVNKTKRKIYYHFPHSYPLPEANRSMVWLSNFRLGSLELEPGNELAIELIFVPKDSFEVKEIGMNLIHEKGEHMGNPSSGEEIIHQTNHFQEVLPLKPSVHLSRHFQMARGQHYEISNIVRSSFASGITMKYLSLFPSADLGFSNIQTGPASTSSPLDQPSSSINFEAAEYLPHVYSSVILQQIKDALGNNFTRLTKSTIEAIEAKLRERYDMDKMDYTLTNKIT